MGVDYIVEIEELEEGTLEPIIISGNHLDILLYKLEQKAELLDYQSVELERYADSNDDSGQKGSLYESPEIIEDLRIGLVNESRALYKLINQIKEAVERDGTSKLKITTKDV